MVADLLFFVRCVTHIVWVAEMRLVANKGGVWIAPLAHSKCRAMIVMSTGSRQKVSSTLVDITFIAGEFDSPAGGGNQTHLWVMDRSLVTYFFPGMAEIVIN